jgi:ribonucleoside-diphosphate reductase alpha chain
MVTCEMIKIEKKIVGWGTVESSFKENRAAKRPQALHCSIHQTKIKGEAWTILVGLLENKPYEVFGGLSKYIEIPKKHKAGMLIKNGKVDGIATYNLVCGADEDQFTVKDVVNVFENTTQGAFTRIISLSLRHGAPVHFVVEQLSKDKYSDITSFSKVIARVLKNYIPDGVESSIQCPDCQSSNVIFESGCAKCLDCLMQKCG